MKLVWLCMLVACSGSHQPFDVSCMTAADNDSCTCEPASSKPATTCDQSTGGGAICCADPAYPASGTCECEQITCMTNLAGDTCTCSPTVHSIERVCMVFQGVCCADGMQCTCYANMLSCPSGTLVANCNAEMFGCAGHPSESQQLTSCTQ